VARVEFFKAPEQWPPEALSSEPEHKPWHGPPLRTLPGRLAETLVLARTDRVAVAVGGFAVYPTGFTFAFETVPRRYGPREWADLDHFGFGHGIGDQGELPPELLRFGVEFADGSRATSLDRLSRRDEDPDAVPRAPVLWPMGGGGGGGRWTHNVWVWPLPPSGPLTFACEWPALDIPLTRLDIDAESVRQAAGRSILLWDDPAEPPPATNARR
jgi:hypothetical protein